MPYLLLFLFYHFHEKFRQDLHASGKCAAGLWQYAIELDPCLVVHILAHCGQPPMTPRDSLWGLRGDMGSTQTSLRTDV